MAASSSFVIQIATTTVQQCSRFFNVGIDTPGRSCSICARPWECGDGREKNLGSYCINWKAKPVETMTLPGFV